MNSFLYCNKKKKRKILDEINVTPFVDVMLVLLIVFMITTPILVSHFNVSLPKAQFNSQDTNSPTNTIEIVLTKNKKFYLFDSPITKIQLQNKLTAIAKSSKGKKRIIVCADEQVVYKEVISLIELSKKCGFHKISLVSKVD